MELNIDSDSMEEYLEEVEPGDSRTLSSMLVKDTEEAYRLVVYDDDVDKALLELHKETKSNTESNTYDKPQEEVKEDSKEVLADLEESIEVILEDDTKKDTSSYSSYIVEDKEPEVIVEDDADSSMIKDYISGVPVNIILGRYGVSAGKMYSILRENGISPRYLKSKVDTRIQNMPAELKNDILKAYREGTPTLTIYDKFNINKNTLYTLLDYEGVERRNVHD